MRARLLILVGFAAGAFASPARGDESARVHVLKLSREARPTISQIMTDGSAHALGEFVNVGLAAESAVWLVVDLRDIARDQSLRFTDLPVDELSTYRRGTNGSLEVAESYKDPLIGAIGVPMPQDPAIGTLVVRILPKQHLSLRLEAHSSNILSIALSRMLALKMMAVAICLVIAAVSLCGFLIFKLPFLIYFGLYGVGMSALLFNYSGLGSLYLRDPSHYGNDVIFVLSHTITAGFFYAFLTAFLSLDVYAPKLDRAFQGGIAFSALASLVALVAPAPARLFVPVSGLVSVSLISAAVLKMIRFNSLPLQIYLASSAVYLAFVSLYILNLAGIAPDHALFGYELPIGTSLDMAMLLAAVAAKAKAIESARSKERERARVILEQSTRLASLGLFAGGIAHEVNNPLAIIKAMASNLCFLIESEKGNKAMILELGGKIENTVDRIAKIVHSLRVLAGGKAAEGDLSVLKLRDIIDPVMVLTRDRFARSPVKFTIDGWQADVYVLGDVVQFSQAVMNLVVNAFDVVQDDPNAWVSAKAYATESSVRIEIANSGPKIPDDVALKVFDPFFTTKPVGSGMGLGLSICKALVDSLGGTIELDAKSIHTTFVLRVDRVAPDENRRAS